MRKKLNNPMNHAEFFQNEHGVVIGYYDNGNFEVKCSFDYLKGFKRETGVKIKFPSLQSASRLLNVQSPEDITGDILYHYMKKH